MFLGSEELYISKKTLLPFSLSISSATRLEASTPPTSTLTCFKSGNKAKSLSNNVPSSSLALLVFSLSIPKIFKLKMFLASKSPLSISSLIFFRVSSFKSNKLICKGDVGIFCEETFDLSQERALNPESIISL